MVALELSCSVAPLSLSWWWCIINRWRRAARKRSKNGEAWNSESCYFRRNKQRGGWTCSVFHSLNDILVRQSFLARPVHTFLSSEIEFRWLLFRTTLMHPLHVFLGKESKNQNGNLRWHLPWRGGVSRGSWVPHTYFEKWFLLKTI